MTPGNSDLGMIVLLLAAAGAAQAAQSPTLSPTAAVAPTFAPTAQPTAPQQGAGSGGGSGGLAVGGTVGLVLAAVAFFAIALFAMYRFVHRPMVVREREANPDVACRKVLWNTWFTGLQRRKRLLIADQLLRDPPRQEMVLKHSGA